MLKCNCCTLYYTFVNLEIDVLAFLLFPLIISFSSLQILEQCRGALDPGRYVLLASDNLPPRKHITSLATGKAQLKHNGSFFRKQKGQYFVSFNFHL